MQCAFRVHGIVRIVRKKVAQRSGPKIICKKTTELYLIFIFHNSSIYKGLHILTSTVVIMLTSSEPDFVNKIDFSTRMLNIFSFKNGGSFVYNAHA
jgi:hypothetical protein